MKRAGSLVLLLFLPLLPLAGQTQTPGGQQPPAPGAPGPPTPGGGGPGTPPSTPPSQQEATKPDRSVPVDKKEKWVVGFCAFDAERLPPEDQYLTYSMPMMLKNQLAGLTSHSLSQAERDLIRKTLVAKGQDAVDQSVTGFYKERDALLLDSIGPNIPSTTDVDAKIAAALLRREFLKSMDLARIKVAEQKPIEVKEGSGVGKLFDPLSIPASVFCDRQGIDLLVGGMVREVQGYVLLEVWAYDATSNSVTVSFTDAEPRDGVYQSVPAAGRELTSFFIGKPWATLSFTADPPESSLFINGKLAATGRTPVLYLAPGTLDITVSAPGYRDLTQTMTLSSEEESSLTVTLEKEKSGTIVISSTPPGADVYLESVWKGKTPLALEKPFGRARVNITEKGYYDMPFSVSESSPPDLSFTLQPDTISRDALQKKARDDFYDSFTWFAFSLPIPLFCYAFALDSAVQTTELVAQGNSSQARSAQLTANLFYGGNLVGTVVSASLFTWMLFKIIHYVSVSNRSAG